MTYRSTPIVLAALAFAPLALAQPAIEKPKAPPADAPAKQPEAAKPAEPKVYTTESGLKYKVETVVSNVRVPWSIVFDPAGRMLFAERPGTVRVYEKGQLRSEPLLKIDNVLNVSETGLMGMCLHPDYAKNKFVYLAFGDKTNKDIRIVRYKDNGSSFAEDKVILSGIAVKGNHSGTCIKFGPDGKLYITTGETFNGELSQDMSSLNGKCLRLNDDGSVPDDNPFAGKNKKEGTRPEIWSFGHRNPQGFDWTADGSLFMSEHGPSGEASGAQKGGGDEFNIVEKGHNYGWPEIHHDMKADGMESPLKQWTPAIAPGGGVILKNENYGKVWSGNYFMAALGGLRGAKAEGGVYRIELKGKGIGAIERLAPDFGRIRAVAVGPDGLIYFSTSNNDGRGKVFKTDDDDRICKIVPVK